MKTTEKHVLKVGFDMEEETKVSLEVPVTKAVEEAVINADPIKVTILFLIFAVIVKVSFCEIYI